MAESKSLPKLPKLLGKENLLEWKLKFDTRLERLQLLPIITGEMQPPDSSELGNGKESKEGDEGVSEAQKTTYADELEIYNNLRIMCYDELLSTLGFTPMTLALAHQQEHPGDAKGLYDRLIEEYTSQKKGRGDRKLDELYSLQQGGTTCAVYVSKTRQLKVDLELAGEDISERLVVRKFISGINSKWRITKRSLQTIKNSISLEEAFSTLIEDEEDI